MTINTRPTDNNNTLPIGVFDSGMGGLTVLRELTKQLPNESFLYLGDTARLPYGTKSEQTIIHYATKMTQVLNAKGIKLLVVACNTASTSALPHLQKLFPELAIVGVVEPSAQEAARLTESGHIALLATETTIHTQIYHKVLQSINPNIQLTTQSCGLFVALAEEGCINNGIADAVCNYYLQPLTELDKPLDTYILGCTHFPVLEDSIRKYLGSSTKIINSAQAVARVVSNRLDELQLHQQPQHSSSVNYFVTDLPERFVRVGETFLGQSISKSAVELIHHQE